VGIRILTFDSIRDACHFEERSDELNPLAVVEERPFKGRVRTAQSKWASAPVDIFCSSVALCGERFSLTLSDAARIY
jgi:hypothetical protein